LLSNRTYESEISQASRRLVLAALGLPGQSAAFIQTPRANSSSGEGPPLQCVCVEADKNPVKNIFDIRDGSAFLLRRFIKRQRVGVYPVEWVFPAEIRGKDDQLYALDVTK